MLTRELLWLLASAAAAALLTVGVAQFAPVKPEPPPNPAIDAVLDKMLEEREAAETASLRRTLAHIRDLTPSEASEVRDLAMQFSVPLETVARDLEGYQRKAETHRLAFKYGVAPSVIAPNLEDWQAREAAEPVAVSVPPRAPLVDPETALALFVALFLGVSGIRFLIWCARGGLRRFRYWPEVLVTAGACAVAWGLAHRIDDGDRFLVTAGTGLVAGTLMTIARR